MTPDDQAAIQFLAELQRLADPTQPAGLRITIRNAEGDYIGDAVLPTPSAQHAVQAVSAMADYHDRDRETFDAGAMIDGLDPRALADLEDHFAEVDLVALTKAVLDDTAPRRRLAVTHAIDDMLGHLPHQDTEGEL